MSNFDHPLGKKGLEEPYPFVTITAHRNKARNVGGTITPFTQKRMRSFAIGINARFVWMNQYRKTQRRPAAGSESVDVQAVR
jgi:hypothetical protein